MLYWRDHPPVHINLQAIVNGFGGTSGAAPAPAASRPAGEPAMSPIEGLSQMLGPPTQKFRPPCRMLPTPGAQTPAQTSATPSSE